jgi:peptidoglycan/LPS O-acetylase OafA/YrhL
VKTKETSRLKTAPTRTGMSAAGDAFQPSADVTVEAPARREQPGLKRRRERVAYLDNLKLLLVAVIIAGHGALAYGDLENAWPYQDVREVQLAGVSNVTLGMVVIPAALFAMGLFFLISGLVTPGSVSRKAREPSRATASYGWASRCWCGR